MPDGDADRGEHEPAPGERTTVSNADAMVLMAQTLLSSGAAERPPADRYQVVVHVDAATLAGDEEGACQLEDGTALHPDTVRRLGCDASLVRILERDGPAALGRPSHTQRAAGAQTRPQEPRPHLPLPRLPAAPLSARPPRRPLGRRRPHRPVQPRPPLFPPPPPRPRGRLPVERGTRGALRFRRRDGQAVPAAPQRATGESGELQRRNRAHGLDLTEQTCVPHIYAGDKLDLHWVVDGLAEGDSRLTGAPPTYSKR
jgi:Domain of unknown function (DUF222)